jgi:hypothetical protein
MPHGDRHAAPGSCFLFLFFFCRAFDDIGKEMLQNHRGEDDCDLRVEHLLWIAIATQTSIGTSLNCVSGDRPQLLAGTMRCSAGVNELGC